MKPVREVKIPPKTLFKSPTLSILRSEMNNIVTIGEVWSSKGDKGWLVDA